MRPAPTSSFSHSTCAGRVWSMTSRGCRYFRVRTWNTRARLADRGVDPPQIGQYAARRDDALAGLPHLVVDGEHPVVAISMYGLSVNRCAAGRSTPTSASTLPGKLSTP